MTDVETLNRCPICTRPTITAFRPFCSRRCADVDLGRWLTEGYRVPIDEDPDHEAGADQN